MPTGFEELAAALSIFKAAVSIISTIDEAFKFSSECRRLRLTCNIILLIVGKHHDLLKDDPAFKELNSSIEKCLAYLDECKKRKWLRNALFEVTFHRRIKKYRKQFDEWLMSTNFSVTASNLANSSLTIELVKDLKETSKQNFDTVIQNLSNLDFRVSLGNAGTVPIISATDIESASTRPAGYTEFHGVTKTGERREPVICIPFKTKGTGPESTRLISNYAALSNRAYVEKFYGVLRDQRGEYLVMEDLQAQSDVAQIKVALSRAEYVSASHLEKLLLCYEIANTVANFHKAEIVVKVISDSFVYLRFKEKRLLPIFTKLEWSRSFLYPTDEISLDPLYEAPEYGKDENHSIYHTTETDIWSLGRLFWEVLDPDSYSPNKNLKGTELSAAFEKVSSPIHRRLIGDCFLIHPDRRPKATSLAQRLLKEHNDACAKLLDTDSLLVVVDKCRKSVNARRRDHEKAPTKDQLLTKSECHTLLQYEDSWVSGTPIRTPEIFYLIGAGILWDIIWPEYVEMMDFPNGDVDDESYPASPPVHRDKLASQYLSAAIEMGCYEANYEMTVVYRRLAKWYEIRGGKDVNEQLKRSKVAGISKS